MWDTHMIEDWPSNDWVSCMCHAWGLRRAPFATDEKSRGIFASASHSEALTFMDTTAALRGVMLLTGPPGSGRSTVLKSWMAALEPKRFLPLLITQASLSATGVLEIILAKTGTSPKPASIAISSHKRKRLSSPCWRQRRWRKRRRLEGGSRSRSASPRLSVGRRG
jgi:type II secretory pathway predicted ATPase ExeA